MPKTFKNRLVIPKSEAEGGWHQRGYFPHFDGEDATQHVSFHLADSMPQAVLDRWRIELQHLARREADTEFRTRIQDYLDAGHGACWLRDDRAAELVQNALLHFDGEQYELLAWCVMPNHVHALFTPLAGYVMSDIVGDWKSVTSHRCNKLLGLKGRFWHKEYFDRYIRNERHYQNAVAYIENNPVKAGLCVKPKDWQWSSAGYARALACGTRRVKL
ncbi:MAG: transposase [Acidobacteriota bacterium]|nr:transposase [Acidobacteriota bacterium]